MQEFAMTELCDLQIHINGEQTFVVNEKTITKFCGKLKEMEVMVKINQENPRKNNLVIEIDDFPGGQAGFELVSRFCYSNGRGLLITLSTVSILHCCSVYLDMSEKVSRTRNNLVEQTQTFLEGMFYWSLNDLLVCLKSCESFADYADSVGFLPKLIRSLLLKIVQNSTPRPNVVTSSSSSSSSSPDEICGFRLLSSSRRQPWWFDDLVILPPKVAEKVIVAMGSNGDEDTSLTTIRFIVYYLKTNPRNNTSLSKTVYVELAKRAVDGVVLIGKSAFSCRGLFWVLRAIVSGFGLNKIYRRKLENLIGGLLNKATLDDLLVRNSSGHGHGCVYDVNLILRLIKVFVRDGGEEDHVAAPKMKKVGWLIDKYLSEIAPDHNLKVSKFVAVLKSLPDSARDYFDGVYRAIDIHLESHPNLSNEEQSRICSCLNYEKLSLEACRNLAKNPRIPPRVAVQALISQQTKIPKMIDYDDFLIPNHGDCSFTTTTVKSDDDHHETMGYTEEITISSEDMRLNLERMMWRVVELEKVCRDMKCQMSKVVNDSFVTFTGLHRLC